MKLTRITRGVTKKQRHKKVLSLTKGHKGSRSKLYRIAKESMLHALHYAYVHRREKKGDMRKLWNVRINAAARLNGLSYSKLINGLKIAGITIDRKMLAEVAAKDPEAFTFIANQAKPSN